MSEEDEADDIPVGKNACMLANWKRLELKLLLAKKTTLCIAINCLRCQRYAYVRI